jgi:N-methylhydantoinase B
VVSIDNPARLGIMREVTRSVLEYFAGDLGEGDIILTNDPFSGGSHIQDVTLVKPLFVAGQLVSCGVIQAHLADLGGMALGGYYPFALEIWAEGVRVTPVKLYRGGALQNDALTMLTLNSRLPHLVDKDLQAMVGALDICQEEATQLGSQPMPMDYDQVLREIIARTATRVQAEIREYPEGVWSGECSLAHSCLNSTELLVRVRVTVSAGSLILDFSGSSAPAKGFVNSTAATTMSAALVPLLFLWQSAPANEGVFHNLSFVIPEPTFLQAKLPMSVGWSPYQPSLEIATAVASALAQVRQEMPPPEQLEAVLALPQLPFSVAGCGGQDCPFPSLRGDTR